MLLRTVGRRTAAALVAVSVLALNGCTGSGTVRGHGTTIPVGTTAAPTPVTTPRLVYTVQTSGRLQLAEIDADGQNGTAVPGGALCCYAPALSPDGTRLAVLGEGVLDVGGAAGEHLKAIWTSPTLVASALAWAPDSRTLAFAVADTSAAGPPRSVIYTTRPDGTGVRTVARAVNVHALAWSPDGTQLAFLQNQGGIWAAPAHGGPITQVYGPEQREPSNSLPGTLSWSPGRTLLFTDGFPPAAWELPAGAGHAHSILGDVQDVSWCPGGTQFAAVRNGRIELVTATGEVRAVLPPEGVRSVQCGGGAPLPSTLRLAAFDISGANGLSLTTTPATVNDGNVHASAADLPATIDWGDGTPSTPAVIDVDNDSARCPCTVTGTHTYTAEGTYDVTTTVTRRARPGIPGAVAQAASTARISWAILLPNDNLSTPVREPSPAAVATLVYSRNADLPTSATAGFDWRDGTAPDVENLDPAAQVDSLGPTRGTAVATLAIGVPHTFAVAGVEHGRVSLTAPGHLPITGTSVAQVTPTKTRFLVTPTVPHIGDVAWFAPLSPSATGAPVSEYDWNFGDGTPTFHDTPAVRAGWRALVQSSSDKLLHPDPQFITAASGLGIDLTLGGHVDPGQGARAWLGLLGGTIPHVFDQPTAYRVYLSEHTSAGLVTTATNVTTQAICDVWGGGYIPILRDYTPCDTMRGWQIATSFPPSRRPDYYSFQIGGVGSNKFITGGLSAGLTITADGTVFLTVGGALGLGLSTSNTDSPQRGLAFGYVEKNSGPDPPDSLVDAYVAGWTYNASAGITLGPVGFALTIVMNNDPLAGGEEYFASLQQPALSASLTAGASCSVKLGTVHDAGLAVLSTLVPPATGPWPWQDPGNLPTVTPSQIAAALQAQPSPADAAPCLGQPS